jgi:glycosyltransferase involved in cell wall biosynthesis
MKVILIGNYLPDGQRSMAAFGEMLRQTISSRGPTVELIVPEDRLLRLTGNVLPKELHKWLGYVDKFILFPLRLRKIAKQEVNDETVFHIIDHSNAMYGPWLGKRPYVTTCHDMLAVRGGLGDPAAFCPASKIGTLLQRWILNSLKKNSFIACDSEATRMDLARLTDRISDPDLVCVPISANALFKPLSEKEIQEHLPKSLRAQGGPKFLLMVGSALPRKNRETALRTLSLLKNRWNGVLVVAGAPLSLSQRQLAKELNLGNRVIEVIAPSHEQLNALYCGAQALLFPSYAEGFGWPITEANACDCPVLCSDRTSVPEVAGDAALIYDAEDSEGFAQGVLRLAHEPDLRKNIILKGRKNLERFTTEKMLEGYINLYQRALSEFP